MKKPVKNKLKTVLSAVIYTLILSESDAVASSYDKCCYQCCYDHAYDPSPFYSHDCRWYGGIDYLYLIPNEDNLYYAAGLTPTDNIEQLDINYQDMKFNWDSGGRITLGVGLPCDQWDLEASWLTYGSRSKGSIETEIVQSSGNVKVGFGFTGTALFPEFINLIDTFENFSNGVEFVSSAIWKLQVNQLDLVVGRTFLPGHALKLRPFLGFRMLLINQHLDVVYDIPVVASAKNFPFTSFAELKNDFQSLGLVAGLNSAWDIAYGFGIYGVFDTALLYGRVKSTNNWSANSIPPNANRFKEVSLNNVYYALKANIDLSLGLQWECLFSNNRSSFTIRTGWESHLYFSQNNFLFPDLSGERSGDLSLAGFVISLSASF